MIAREFRLPDVGEGLTEADIVSWHIKPGDLVTTNQVIVEIETAKSLVELPSPFTGTVTELLVAEGETAAVGTALLRVAVEDAAAEPASTPSETKQSVLVGYGPTKARVQRRNRRPQHHTGDGLGPVRAQQEGIRTYPGETAGAQKTLRAKPPVRKLARDLGVDLGTVTPSGSEGTITRDDVVGRAAHDVPNPHESVAVRERHDQAVPSETRIPVKGVRRATAAAMSASAFTAPHVTEFVTVDVTRTVKLLGKLKKDVRFAGVRMTPLLVIAKALLAAVRKYPEINASWDDAAGEIVIKHPVNLGIAAATDRGLVVPNIKHAEHLSLSELATAIDRLVSTARDGRLQPSDMAGGTITITNIGMFGVDSATPILNPGEAVILCVGAVRKTPWNHRGTITLRWTAQLSLSFDHRLIDGDVGSKVLSQIVAILQNPRWELLVGG